MFSTVDLSDGWCGGRLTEKCMITEANLNGYSRGQNKRDIVGFHKAYLTNIEW